MLVTNQQQTLLRSNKDTAGVLGVTNQSSINGNTLPLSTVNKPDNIFSQSLMQAKEIYSSTKSVNGNNINKTDELTEVEARKKLASAMPLLIQALEKLEAESTQLGDTYNQVTINDGIITKAEILQLADLEEKITKTKAEIEQIMAPLDMNESHTKQLSVLLLPVFKKIEDELEILYEFNKKASEQLASIESNNGNVDLDFSLKLGQEIFELIDQDKRLLPFSFAADDLIVINHFLNKNYNSDNMISRQQSIKNTEEFIESFEKYQDDRKEAYLAQKNLKLDNWHKLH